MTTRNFMIPMFVVLAGCGAETLKVGNGSSGSEPASTSTDEQGSSSSGTSEVGEGGQESASGVTSCGASDCSAFSFTCATGTATNVQCVVDTSNQFAESFCTLTGECSGGAASSCVYTPPSPTCTGSGACAEAVSAGGSGVVTLLIDPPVGSAPSTSVLSAYFDSATDGPGQTYGSCVYNASGNDLVHSGEVGTPAPNPGTITVSASGFSTSAVAACNGLYAPTTSSTTLAAGSLVSFAWSTPGDTGLGPYFPTSLPSVPAPHFATLAASDALAAASPSVTRATDLPVSWTMTGTPLSLESVVVVFAQGQATVACTFDASAGTGVVPADALLALDTGSASFAVYSLHQDEDNAQDVGWDILFDVEMAAATPTGLANGTLTLE